MFYLVLNGIQSGKPIQNLQDTKLVSSLPVPEHPFSDSSPSYQKVTRIIGKNEIVQFFMPTGSNFHQLLQKMSVFKILLCSVPLKIFTACMPDTIFDLIMRNNYIDCKLQKGFMPKVSGTCEHNAHMTHIINQARKKQRSVVITLLDLKNAFC